MEKSPKSPDNTEYDLNRLDIKKQTTISDIARKLIAYFTAGHIRPGERMPSERQLSELIGVSRTTLREALKTLNVLGIIDVRPGDGNYLRESNSGALAQVLEWGISIGEQRIIDLMEARQKLEVDIVDLAAVRASDADVEELAAILLQMRESGPDKNIYAEADTAFHLKLAEISRNSILSELLASIRSLLTAWIYTDLERKKTFEISYLEHEAIYDAIRSRDSRAASIAMEVHMAAVAKRLNQAHEENLKIEDIED